MQVLFPFRRNVSHVAYQLPGVTCQKILVDDLYFVMYFLGGKIFYSVCDYDGLNVPTSILVGVALHTGPQGICEFARYAIPDSTIITASPQAIVMNYLNCLLLNFK